MPLSFEKKSQENVKAASVHMLNDKSKDNDTPRRKDMNKEKDKEKEKPKQNKVTDGVILEDTWLHYHY